MKGLGQYIFMFSIDDYSFIPCKVLFDTSFYNCRILAPCLLEKSKSDTPLVELHLENCELSCDGARQLFKVLAALNVPLKSLSIGDNHLTRLVIGVLRSRGGKWAGG